MVLEINSKDYNSLRTDYSDPNIINRVQGSEFLIDNASVVNFGINASSSISSDGEITPDYSIITSTQTTISAFNFLKAIGWPTLITRSETYSLSGSFTATINEVIYDKNSISVDYEIDYDSYANTSSVLTESNYKTNKFVYEAIRNNTYLVNKDSGDVRIPQILSNKLFDVNKAYCMWYFLGVKINESAALAYPAFNINISKIQVDAITGSTTITCKYTIPIWYGWGEQKSDFLVYRYDYLNVVRSIKFKVRANTINVTENTFDYGNFNEDPYALESNEFLQYQNGEPLEDRMSYNVSQEIFEKTERNRMLVSFNLFRLDKLDWDGDGNLRFIRSRDRIKIKDELGNYLGVYYDDSGNEIIPEFEVIRANGRWDGKFYKEIIAKQVFT